MNIPVFHDDQHGTAIISAAALINALMLVKKEISQIRLVINGAGAAANSCAKLAIALGVKPENMLMCDTKGGNLQGAQGGMNPYAERFAANTKLQHTGRGIIRGRRTLRPLQKGGGYVLRAVAAMGK